MWRFGWVFFLIALFFTTLAFLSSFLACCGRIGSLLASLAALTALIFWTIAAVLMTYVLRPPIRPTHFFYQAIY